MARVNFNNVPDNNFESFEPLPIGKYPCVLTVDNIQRDSSKQPMTDVEGKPVIAKTNAGDEKWSVKATILDGPHVGRWVLDNFSFGDKAVKRVKIVLTRAGIIQGNETDYDCQPDEIDDTCWWVEIDRLEPRKNADGSVKTRKDGKAIVDPRVAFAGYTPMTSEEAIRLKAKYAKWQAEKAAKEAAVESESEGAAGNAGDSGTADDSNVPF